MTWKEAYTKMKLAIAIKNPTYSQSGYMDVVVDGKTFTVRRDCSGYVSAALELYGVFSHNYRTNSTGFSHDSNVAKLLSDAGFKKVPFTSWNNIVEGSIISDDYAHVEIFGYNSNGSHYVYSNGSTTTMRNSGVTKDGGKHKYDTVWIPPSVVQNKPTQPQLSNEYNKTQFIKDVQRAIGAKVDGIAGNETLSKTITVSRFVNNKHTVVLALQKYLNSIGYNCGVADGVAGSLFDNAVKRYQRDKLSMKNPDGELTKGGNTWKKILGLK